MKKTVSVLLVIALLLCAFPLTFASAEDDGVFVDADGTLYQVHQGDKIEYVCYLNIDGKASSIDGALNVDTDGLAMTVPFDEEEEEENINLIFPILGGAAVVNDTDPSRITYNFSNPNGKSFNKSTSKLIRAEFTVTAASGTYCIKNELKTLAWGEGQKYIDNYEVLIQPARLESELTGLTPYIPVQPTEPATDAPTEPATDAPTQAATDAPTEPATDAPTQAATDAPTEPATDAPTQAATDAPTQPATDNPDAYVLVKANGYTFRLKRGDVFEYVYYLSTGERICSLDGELFFDADGLELIIPENDDDLEEEMIFPIFKGDVVANRISDGHIKYNYSNSKGKKFVSPDSVLIRAQFTVTAFEGTYEITNFVHTLAGADERQYLKEDEVFIPPVRSEGDIPDLVPCDPANPDVTVPRTEPPTDAPTQPATDVSTQPATDAPTQSATDVPTQSATDAPTQPATDAAEEGLFIVADGVTYKVRQNEVFVYIYYLCTGERVCSLDAELNYDADALTLTMEDDPNYDDYEEDVIFPKLYMSITSNFNKSPGLVLYNYSNAQGIKFAKETDMLIKAKFRVNAASGTYYITNTLHTLAGSNQHKYIFNDHVEDELVRSEGGIPAKTPYDPENPDATDPPTEAPTPAPTQPPTNPPTQAPTNPPTQPPTNPPTQAQTNPPTQAPTNPPTQPQTSAPTEAPTDPPTEAPTEMPLEGVFVKADGVLYKVSKGDVFEYVYYLNLNDYLCSIDAALYFDTAGLQLTVPLDDDDEPDTALLFPLIQSTVITNDLVPGRIKYNYSNSRGKKFNTDTSELVRAKFTVTASEGVYEINNILDTVAGRDEKKYIFNSEPVNPIQTLGSALPGREPYIPEEQPKILTDKATGIRVLTKLDAKLVVTPIDPADFNYYIYNASTLRLYDVSLVKQDGTPIILTNAVKVQFPYKTCKSVYRFDSGTFTNAQAVYIDDGYQEVRTATLGLFVANTQYTPPKAQMYGNVNLDDEVSIIDVSWIQRDLAGIEHFDADQKKIADVDGDGEESITDGTYIQRWLAGMLSNNPMARFGYPR